MALRDGERGYFYELHENDDELFADVLLAHDAEFDEDEFLAMVVEARATVLERFEEDTLIEAVARELERSQGFTVIDDAQLRAAVNVSANDGETRIVNVDDRRAAATAADAGDDYRSLVLDVEPEDRRWGDA